MPEFKKSDGFQMKRGAKPTFKDLGSSPINKSASPAQWNWGSALGGGLATGSLTGGVIGGLAGPNKETRQNEAKFADVLESEGLKRNFWGKLGFGGRRSRERKQRIKELEAQEQQGIDRDRIEANTGAPVAGPGAA